MKYIRTIFIAAVLTAGGMHPAIAAEYPRYDIRAAVDVGERGIELELLAEEGATA